MATPIIKDGFVINVVELSPNSSWTPPEGCSIGPEGGLIGDSWNGESYKSSTPSLTAIVEECLRSHPEECIFLPGALERIVASVPEGLTPRELEKFLDYAVLREEIYCPHEGIDRRAEFGLL